MCSSFTTKKQENTRFSYQFSQVKWAKKSRERQAGSKRSVEQMERAEQAKK